MRGKKKDELGRKDSAWQSEIPPFFTSLTPATLFGLGDGNCFYRCFLFGYLEMLIRRRDTDPTGAEAERVRVCPCLFVLVFVVVVVVVVVFLFL